MNFHDNPSSRTRDRQKGTFSRSKVPFSINDHTEICGINSHTNIIVMSVSQRHDLCDWSCVNPKVKTFNRKLVNLMKPFKHVTVIKVELERKLFTRQGLHMNKLGKERIALRIANTATTVLQKQTEEPISMYMKTEQDDSVSDVSSEVNIV
jgi:hypothetical protein